MLPTLATENEAGEITSIDRDVIFESIQDQEFAPGEFIVKFSEDEVISDLSVDTLNERYLVGAIEKVFRNAENTILENIYKFTVPEDADILSIIKKYTALPNVEYAEPNYVIKPCSIPNDPEFGKQWGLHNTGQNGGTIDVDIDAPEAWDIEQGSSDIIIAILDSGIDLNHPDLVDNIWVNEDEIADNDVDDDGNGYVDDIHSWNFFDNDAEVSDIHSHGTICAGIAAAVTDNDKGVAGVSRNCKIMPVLVGGRQTWDTTTIIVSDGIRYAADNGAHVVSMSFGWYDPSYLVKDALDYAYEKGLVLVSSAHNHGVSNRNYPAAYDNVIAVGGINRNNNRMEYHYEIVDYWVISNYGSWVDIAAPSQEIFSTMPTYEVFYNRELELDLNYDYASGNSMAAPLVAGVSALLLSQNPSLTPNEVKFILRATTDPYDSEYYLGTGCVNAYQALVYDNKPVTPIGPQSGKAGETYAYSSTINYVEDEELYFLWDWGDGTYSGWLGPYNSGETCEVSYSWVEKGDYSIRVKAKDAHNGESDWSDPLAVSMPKNGNSLEKLRFFGDIANNGIILMLAFPTEFFEYETNYTFMCPGRGYGFWITPEGMYYQTFCGAVLDKDTFYGIANPIVVLGVKVI
jgi:subtilisin family serine protease